MRANTGGKSLDKGSVFGAISQCRSLESAPKPEICSLRAGGAQIGGELARSGEALECRDQPRHTEPRTLRASWRGEAGGPNMGADGEMAIGTWDEKRNMRRAAAACCLWSAPANQCRSLCSGPCSARPRGVVARTRPAFPSCADWLLGQLAADQCSSPWTPMCSSGICAGAPCIGEN